MCLIVPSRVISVTDAHVDVELADGRQTTATNLLESQINVGEYVLVDRGFVIEVISKEDAEAVLALYAAMAEP